MSAATKTSALLVLLAAAACDSGAEWSPTMPPPEKVEVQPPHVVVARGQQALLAATFVPGGADTHVTWSATGGSIGQDGVYTAGNTSGSFAARATSVAAPSIYGEAAITITTPITVNVVDPGNVTACETTQLVATVTGAGSAVTWTALDPSCGSFGGSPAMGLFTSSRGSGGCPVRACSQADLGACGDLLVQVVKERVLGVSVAPASTTLEKGTATQLSASVQTSCGTFAAGS